MVYVFDTNSFIVLSNYYKVQFPSLVKNIDSEVKAKRIISVKEFFNEIELYSPETELKNGPEKIKRFFSKWVKKKVKLYLIYLKNILNFKIW